jgi:hypothetical protein
MFKLRTTAFAAVAAITVAGLTAASPAAMAKGGGDVRVAGTCTGHSTSKLKLSNEDGGRIQVEFEVDQNRNGVPWNVALQRNGTQVASATATTRAPSGSFEFRRVIARASGSDRIVASATTASGERCSATAST